MFLVDPTADPDLFTIEQSKMMGLWPPGDAMSPGIFPYINRLFPGKKLTVVEVGVRKGENVVYTLENDVENRIEKYYGVVVHPEYESLLEKNLTGEKRFIKGIDLQEKNSIDVVLLHSECDLDKNLKPYYDALSVGGIFAGNDHAKDHVKISLRDFRRENRVGIPINVSHGCWFWWKR